MSVLRRNDLIPFAYHNGNTEYPGGKHPCFHCGRNVAAPHAINWRGTDEDNRGVQIWLHPGCAVDFVIRLMRDLHEVQLIEGVETFMREPKGGAR